MLAEKMRLKKLRIFLGAGYEGAFLCVRSEDEAKKESLEDKREHLQIVISMKKTRESPEARLYFQRREAAYATRLSRGRRPHYSPCVPSLTSEF